MILNVFLVIFLLYVVSVFYFIFGNLIKSVPVNKTVDDSVSVIVAVRNGERSLPELLNILSNQIYDGSLEFIIVDDESMDRTKDIILYYANRDQRIKYVSSSESPSVGLRYKKRALDAGIYASKGDILLFTDVDCRMGKYWVRSMASHFMGSVDYVVGFTHTNPVKSWVSRFQAVDLYILMASTRGTTQWGFPLASTGQNQAFRRHSFDRMGGYSLLRGFLQGDDSLFLQIARKHAGSVVAFASEPNAFVTGRTENAWNSFIRQRIRWSGDTLLMWKFNRLFFIYLFVVYLTNWGFLISLFGIFTLKITIWIWIIKFICEYVLFLSVRFLFNSRLPLVSFIFWFFVNILYTVFMGTMSIFSSRFSWHGRALQN